MAEIFKELETTFQCEEVKNYFEIRRKPDKPTKFNFLTRPTPGECIVAEENESNRWDPINTTGTITMFYFQNNRHYALTCFHVGTFTDMERFKNAFNEDQYLEGLHPEAVKWRKEYAKNKINYYVEKEIPETGHIDFGKFHEGSYDKESDIMSVEVNVDVDCKIENLNLPNVSTMRAELKKRIYRLPRKQKHKDHRVVAQKAGASRKTSGYIIDMNFNYTYNDELLIKNAYALKSDSREFLKPGDSGALMCFLDLNGNEQAFGYCACSIPEPYPDENEDDDVVFQEEPESERELLFICFRLDTAFKKLKLEPEMICCNDCGSTQQGGCMHF